MKHDETERLEIESTPLRDIVIDSKKSEKSSNAVIASAYNPYTDDTVKGGVSYSHIMMHIIVISSGPTMLSLPSNFINVGYITGTIGIVITIFLYALCVRILLSNEYELCRREKVPSMSYATVTELALRCGPLPFRRLAKYARWIVYAIFLSIWTFGSSLIFVLAAENMKKFHDFLAQPSDLSPSHEVDLQFVMLYLIAPCVLLCWMLDLKYLMYLSFFTNATNIFGIIVITYYVVQDLPSLDSRTAMGHVKDIPLFVGNIFFTVNATALMIPTKDEMKFKRRFAASKFNVVTVSYALVAVTYVVFGLLCYLKFGSNMSDSVIRNLPDTSFTRIVVGVYGIGNCCFYPLVAYVSQDVLWNDMLKTYVRESKYHMRWQFACRTLVVFVSIMAAFLLPNIELFLLVTGTVGTPLDSLIIPATCQLLIKYGQQQRTASPKRVDYGILFRNGLIIAIGVVLIVVGLIDCVERIAQLMK